MKRHSMVSIRPNLQVTSPKGAPIIPVTNANLPAFCETIFATSQRPLLNMLSHVSISASNFSIASSIFISP
ncbi:MAG: hypothetical protein QXR45_10070, partial [Candidatus Bathyarchaeia archaeon]